MLLSMMSSWYVSGSVFVVRLCISIDSSLIGVVLLLCMLVDMSMFVCVVVLVVVGLNVSSLLLSYC